METAIEALFQAYLSNIKIEYFVYGLIFGFLVGWIIGKFVEKKDHP